MEQVSVSGQLRGVDHHGGHVVHKLRDQTGGAVIRLTEVKGHHLQRKRASFRHGGGGGGGGGLHPSPKFMASLTFI